MEFILSKDDGVYGNYRFNYMFTRWFGINISQNRKSLTFTFLKPCSVSDINSFNNIFTIIGSDIQIEQVSQMFKFKTM